LIQTVARAIITDSKGSLAAQLNRHIPVDMAVPHITVSRTHHAALPAVTAMPRHDLMFFNGLGGFTTDGREYIVSTAHLQVTPAPWVNVLANQHF
jgi:cellobiose phosphorylase